MLAIAQEAASHRIVAEERDRLARELHDVIAHCACVIAVQAGAVRAAPAPEQERERRRSRPSRRPAPGHDGSSSAELVGILHGPGTRPRSAPNPRLPSLDTLVAPSGRPGLPVDVDVEGEGELAARIDLSAYRLVQEALTNTLKYAGPAQAWVTLRWRDDELSSRSHDGRSGASADRTGHGLAGMRERVAMCGGTLETGPRDGGGFVVRCHLPTAAQPQTRQGPDR